MSAMNWVKSTLDSAGGRYREMHHPPAYTAQELAEAEHVSGRQVIKTVAVNLDGNKVLLVLPACRKAKLGKVRALAGALEIRLMSEGEMTFHFPECEIG